MPFHLKRLVEEKGPAAVSDKFCDLISQGKLDQNEKRKLGLKNLWESFVGPVSETLPGAQYGEGFIKMRPVHEADVRQSAFSNITGVLLGSKVIDAYKAVPTIGDRLVDPYPSRLKLETLPGFTAHEGLDEVPEGQEYNETGFTDKYVTLSEPPKKGRLISITEEAIIYDQTAQVLKRASLLGERAALDKEKDILNAVTGTVNRYYPSNVETALYGAAPYLIAANPLTDWTSIEKAEIDGLAAMADEQDEKILVVGKVLLVPVALKYTAMRITKAVQVIHGDFEDAISAKTVSGNPLEPGYTILSSPLVHGITSSTTTWFFGDPQKQFVWKEIFPIQTFRAPDNHPDRFRRDIVELFKVRHKGKCFAIDNKHFVKCTK